MARASYQNRIIQDEAVLVGKPVVKGTRISVELVLSKLALNPDWHDLITDYPRLNRADIQACLEFAAQTVRRRYHESKHAEDASR